MNVSITSLQQVGGAGGNAFTACAEGSVKGLNIRSGAWIDSVQVIYSGEPDEENSTDSYGGRGGGLGHFLVHPGERISRITLTWAQYINSISIETSKGRKAVFGQESGHTQSFDIPQDAEFAGFYGRCGNYVDALGVLVAHRNNLFSSGL